MNDEIEKATDDLMELGAVSEETHGGVLGHTWDGAANGRRWP